MKQLALCADDFGLSTAIDQGILELVHQGRLTEVSCLVGFPAWARDAGALAATGVRCGLHLNLTEGRPLSPRLAARWPRWPPLPLLILRAHAHALPMDELREELALQMAAFERAFGRAPDHLDGHQHVHHLPGVWVLVMDLAGRHSSLRIRNTGKVSGPGFMLKRWLIAKTGGRKLRERLRERSRQQNEQLFGVYDFLRADYRTLMRRWLARMPERGGLLFCHPGRAGPVDDGESDTLPDPIAAARVRELAYLSSSEFAADLAAAGVALARPNAGSALAKAAPRTTSGG